MTKYFTDIRTGSIIRNRDLMGTVGKKFEFRVKAGNPRVYLPFSIAFSPDGWTISGYIADERFAPSGPESLPQSTGDRIHVPIEVRMQLLDLHASFPELSDRLVQARLSQIAEAIAGTLK